MPIKKSNYYLIRRVIIKMLGGKCQYCGKKEKLEFDHIVPNGTMRHDVSRSKREWEWFAALEKDNLRLLCKNCNNLKSDSMPIYFSVASGIL